MHLSVIVRAEGASGCTLATVGCLQVACPPGAVVCKATKVGRAATARVVNAALANDKGDLEAGRQQHLTVPAL